MASGDPIVTVQGGVHSSVVANLKKDLAACGYTPHDKSFMVFFFYDWHDEWDGRPFGLKFKSDKAKDFEDTNIHPVALHDPTPLKHWQEAELRTFYAEVEIAKEAFAQGYRIISVCMKGENRSKALQHALDPKDAHLPKCVSMQAAARGYRNGCDMTIWPLGPERGSRAKTARAEAATEDTVAKKMRKA